MIHIKRIIKTKIFFLANVAPHLVISSSTASSPIARTTYRHMKIAAMGIITELVMKSKKSRNCIPMIFTSAHGPYPMQDRVPRATMMTPITTVESFRFHPSSSSKVDTAASVRAMADVSAAKNTSRKNRNPIRVDMPMLSRTFGIVMNIRLGPAFRTEALQDRSVSA